MNNLNRDPTKVYYREGGNPPTNAGLFDHTGKRLVWWPAGYQPTNENMRRVMLMVEAGPLPISRERVREVLNEVDAMYLMDALGGVAKMIPASGDGGVFGTLNPIMSVFPEMVERMRHTPRYLLDNATVAAAVELTLGRPKVLLEALAHLRLPYPRMWIEWEESGRKRIREVFSDENHDVPGRPLPVRLGFLIEADDTGRRGQITWVWSSPASNLRELDVPNIAPISPFFDLDKQVSDGLAHISRLTLSKLWQADPVQLRALYDIWRTANTVQASGG